jgi:hypothetical protein
MENLWSAILKLSSAQEQLQLANHRQVLQEFRQLNLAFSKKVGEEGLALLTPRATLGNI